MIKQKIGGRTVNTVSATGSSADMTTLSAILEGELTIYESKFEGGTVAPSPSALNTKKFSVGKKSLTLGTQCAAVSIPHLKPTKNFDDMLPAIVGKFDESYKSSAKCVYANMFYDRKEV